MFMNLGQGQISSHILSLISGSEYLQREIADADRAGAHVKLETDPSKLSTTAYSLTSTQTVVIGPGNFNGSQHQDYRFCEDLGHELEHVIDHEYLYNAQNPPDGEQSLIQNIGYYDYYFLTTESIAEISQEIVKTELIEAAPVADPTVSLAVMNAFQLNNLICMPNDAKQIVNGTVTNVASPGYDPVYA